MNNKIYLIGSMGSGKSSIGKLLAKELDIPYYDLDKTIESDEAFDLTKLKINCTEWVDLKIIHSLEYDGKIYLPDEADTIHEAMAIWIDD